MNPFPTAIDSVSDIVALRRESVRESLSIAVILLLGSLALFIAVWVLSHNGDTELIISGVFAPIVGISGTVLGFYFSQENKRG